MRNLGLVNRGFEKKTALLGELMLVDLHGGGVNRCIEENVADRGNVPFINQKSL